MTNKKTQDLDYKHSRYLKQSWFYWFCHNIIYLFIFIGCIKVEEFIEYKIFHNYSKKINPDNLMVAQILYRQTKNAYNSECVQIRLLFEF